MGIKVYGHPNSPAARRVLLCLAEKGLDYEFIFIDLATGQQNSEPLISINVPAFEDGDLKLFESRAITKYIAHAYAGKGTQLAFQDLKKMAIVGVWLEVEAQKFDPVAANLNYEFLIKPLKGLQIDDSRVEQLEGQLGSVLDKYEARLAKSKYLGGDDYSLADMHHVPLIANLMNTKVKALIEARPFVCAWAADIQARPASQKVLASI